MVREGLVGLWCGGFYIPLCDLLNMLGIAKIFTSVYLLLVSYSAPASTRLCCASRRTFHIPEMTERMW